MTLRRKNGLTLRNDGEIALVLPSDFVLARNDPQKWHGAFVVRRVHMTQQEFLSEYPAIEEGEEWLASLRRDLKISDKELDVSLQRAHLENESRRLLKKLIAVQRERNN